MSNQKEEANSRHSLSAEKQEEISGRMNVLSVVIQVAKELGEKATVENVVKRSMQIKKQKSAKKYERLIRNELVWDEKTQIVSPKLSENGWKKALTFAASHAGHNPALEIFPESQIENMSKKLNIPLPKLKKAK